MNSHKNGGPDHQVEVRGRALRLVMHVVFETPYSGNPTTHLHARSVAAILDTSASLGSLRRLVTWLSQRGPASRSVPVDVGFQRATATPSVLQRVEQYLHFTVQGDAGPLGTHAFAYTICRLSKCVPRLTITTVVLFLPSISPTQWESTCTCNDTSDICRRNVNTHLLSSKTPHCFSDGDPVLSVTPTSLPSCGTQSLLP